jgi:LPXTG-motif cell wall-anchored protein
MGIIEFHLHEPDFDFSPSMRTGGEPGEDEHEDEREDAASFEVEDDSGGSGMGALVALGVLVALGALVGLRRRRKGGDDDLPETGPDEEIEISA